MKHHQAERGFVLLWLRWFVERSFAWATRFRRLVKDYERLPTTVAGLHFLAFGCLMFYRHMIVLYIVHRALQKLFAGTAINKDDWKRRLTGRRSRVLHLQWPMRPTLLEGMK